MRHDHPEQSAAARQRLQAQLDSLAKLRGYAAFTLEKAEAIPQPTTQRLRSPRVGLEKRQRPPLPHPAAPKPQARQDTFLEHESHKRATALLEPYRKALGKAYETLHLLARWSTEHTRPRMTPRPT